ncbi:MAG: AAA family ATPase [Myxococcota bacterium]|nr:AAA family ATPase [Myxococcota bacterium]
MFDRYYDNLSKILAKNKVLIVYGARQVGKTTLLERYLRTSQYRYKLDSGDNVRTQEVLGSRDFDSIRDYISGYDLIAIDEAQEIPHIGAALKIVNDQSPQTLVIATGSSSFELAQQVGEPLTGRKRSVVLYPMSQIELLKHYNRHELKERLAELLIFGSYPEVLTSTSKREKARLLKDLVDSYLLKDVLAHERVKSPKALLKLLKLLAFQVGNEVSLSELAGNIGVDVKTVGRFLDLLEKSFVIRPLHGFSRNLRKEVVSKNKYYFLDTGIRNAVISQFNPLEDRNDTGALFENFLLMERIKKLAFEDFYGNIYFWRTYDGQEIDYIEEVDGSLSAHEFKWSTAKRVKIPKDWQNHYPDAHFTQVNRNNYLDFVS